MIEQLTLVVGSANPFELHFKTASGLNEILVGASDYTVVIRLSTTGTIILKRTKTDGNVTLDVSTAKLVCTLTQMEADGLSAGVFIGEAAVLYTTNWYHTKTFTVNIVKAVATHS